jgi:hypothetical protein
MGVIIAFQSAVAMRQFGAEIYVADLIGLAMLRALGPLMTAILLAGRTGAAFAAELGTMQAYSGVNQHADGAAIHVFHLREIEDDRPAAGERGLHFGPRGRDRIHG